MVACLNNALKVAMIKRMVEKGTRSARGPCRPGMQTVNLFERYRDKQRVLLPFDQEKQTILAFCLLYLLN
jgi:hypothetical protein